MQSSCLQLVWERARQGKVDMSRGSLPREAYLFAVAAHSAVGQKRKYTGESYIVHPMEVAALVSTVPHTHEMLAAALLHDVQEDTHVTNEEIKSCFGIEVSTLVDELSDVSRPEHGNRATRKEIDRKHLAGASPQGQTIKLADLLSNSVSIIQHDPNFARAYLREKAMLLDVLTVGDEELMRLAKQVLLHGQERILASAI